jgi:lipopolysaccharide heptosyltransferase I
MSDSTALAPSSIQRLLIVRLSAMGDIIHTLPAATALRHAFPQATIGWIVEERWTELLCTLRTPRSGPRSPQRPLADKIHTVNTTAWRNSLLSSSTWHQIMVGLSELRGEHYDVAVDFQGAIRSAVLARVSGAPVVYGVAQPRENASSLWYTRQVIARGTHIIEQNFSLAEAVARRRLTMPRPEFPCDPAGQEQVDRRLREHGLGPFAILNPGAGWGAKRWPAERYGYVAKKLGEAGLKSIINCGPGEEALAKAVEAASGGAAKAMACSLTELIALTRRAQIFIGGDTGPMHLAAALGVPVVGIFGPTNPARNGPYGTASVVLRSPSSPTSHSRRSQPDEGMLEIGGDQVVATAFQLLRSTCGRDVS